MESRMVDVRVMIAAPQLSPEVVLHRITPVSQLNPHAMLLWIKSNFRFCDKHANKAIKDGYAAI